MRYFLPSNVVSIAFMIGAIFYKIGSRTLQLWLFSFYTELVSVSLHLIGCCLVSVIVIFCNQFLLAFFIFPVSQFIQITKTNSIFIVIF
jgi:hypothetical protein